MQWARSLSATPEFQVAWQILTDGIPRGWPTRSEKPIDPTALAIEHGRIQGYWDCLEMLCALEILPNRPRETVDVDYATPAMSQNGEESKSEFEEYYPTR